MMVSECERKTRLGENDLKEGSARGKQIKLLRFKSFDAIRAYYDYNQHCSCDFFNNKKAKSIA